MALVTNFYKVTKIGKSNFLSIHHVPEPSDGLQEAENFVTLLCMDMIDLDEC